MRPLGFVVERALAPSVQETSEICNGDLKLRSFNLKPIICAVPQFECVRLPSVWIAGGKIADECVNAAVFLLKIIR